MHFEPKRALVLRVRRDLAGKTLPFDKLYFFHTGMGPIIARVFPYSLVLTLTADFTKMIQEVVKGCTAHEAFPLRRKDEKAVKAAFSVDAFKDVIENRAKYWAVVPTLYLTHTMTDVEGNEDPPESKPAYICAKPERHYARDKQRHNRKTVSPELTQAHQRERMDKLQSVKSYLLVAGEVYRPICVACPNHMEVLNGRCFFGSQTCYEQLSVTTPSAFVAGMKAYKQFVGGQTPELELEGLK
jgi:hypothetical protein